MDLDAILNLLLGADTWKSGVSALIGAVVLALIQKYRNRNKTPAPDDETAQFVDVLRAKVKEFLDAEHAKRKAAIDKAAHEAVEKLIDLKK